MAPDRPAPLSVDQLVDLFHAALAAGDVETAVAALQVLAVRAPRRARVLLEATETALAIAQAGDGG